MNINQQPLSVKDIENKKSVLELSFNNHLRKMKTFGYLSMFFAACFIGSMNSYNEFLQ